MKNFLSDLIKTEVIALIAVPSTIIGMCMAGVIYGEKIEPWLEKKLRKTIK